MASLPGDSRFHSYSGDRVALSLCVCVCLRLGLHPLYGFGAPLGAKLHGNKAVMEAMDAIMTDWK